MTYCRASLLGSHRRGIDTCHEDVTVKTRSGVTLVIGLTKVILSSIKVTQRAHFVFKLTEIRNQDFKQKHIILKKKLISSPHNPQPPNKE